MKQLILPAARLLCLLCLTATSLTTSCKKDSKANPPAEVIEITAKGVTTETPKSATIGAQGGKLVSRDGQLEIAIPAGALSANTTISVVAVTNTSSAGVGLNYRIEPHMEFAKPVKLTFSYATVEDSLGAPGLTGISYQDAAGIWQLQRTSLLDESKKQISVEANHFSDWSLSAILRAMPGYTIMPPGDEIEIFPYTCIPHSELENIGNWKLPNGSNTQIPLLKPYIVPAEYTDGAQLIGGSTRGAGTLSDTEIPGVIFKASTDISPVLNPATIVFAFRNTHLGVTAKIQIMQPITGFKLEINGKTYQYDTAFAGKAGDEYEIDFYSKKNNQLFRRGYIAWKGSALGAHSWSDDNIFQWEPEDMSPKRLYRSYYNDNMDLSKGEVIIHSFGGTGEMVSGEFRVRQAGATNIESGDGEYLGQTEIKGGFLVRRSY